MSATLRDVAAAAGVSVSTASRALSRPELVGEPTLSRVLAAAAGLRYSPNRAARALITGRNQNIGLVVPDLDNPFYSSIVKGAQARMQASDRTLLIADTDENPRAELGLVERLARQVDALVLCSSRMSEDELHQAQALRPVVLVNRSVPGVPAIRFDVVKGVREVATHLRALDHRRIGYVAGPRHSFSNADREQVIAQVFAADGLELVQLGHRPPSFQGGRDAADEVLAADVSAVMAYNDVMALGLVNRLMSYGVDVPAELSVVGWDDIEFAEMFTPALTTVHMPREEAGRDAIAYLDSVLQGETPSEPVLATRLVFRRTTTRAAQAVAHPPEPPADPGTSSAAGAQTARS